MHYVYVIKICINDKVYVGQTRNMSQRKAGHFYSARKDDHRPLYCAIREFGVDKFTFQILEECDDPIIASQREEHWVSRLNSLKDSYNLTYYNGYHVGNLGRKFVEEHKRKISEVDLGRKHSHETISKMKSHIFVKENCRKLSEAAKRREALKRQEHD